MARYDKIPIGDSFRAPLLAAESDAADLNKVFGVGLDANGRLVLGAGHTGIKGVIIYEQAVAAGQAFDVMKRGEIVMFDVAPLSVASPTAGTNYYVVPATGVVTATATNNVYIGHTVEAGRLVVNVDDKNVTGAV
jgi:hypothetical protein